MGWNHPPVDQIILSEGWGPGEVPGVRPSIEGPVRAAGLVACRSGCYGRLSPTPLFLCRRKARLGLQSVAEEKPDLRGPSPFSQPGHSHVRTLSFSSCFLQEASWTPAGLAPARVQTEAPVLRPSQGRRSGRHRGTLPWQEPSSGLWKRGAWLLSWDWSPHLSPTPGF